LSFQLLYRIHKGLFDAVEEDHTDEKDHQHGAKAVTQHRPADGAGAQKSKPKGFHDGRDRVDDHQPAVLGRDGGDRVNDRGGIHPQLHAEGHQKAQVTVLGGQRRDDDAKAQSQPSHQEQEHGQQKDIPGHPKSDPPR
jgi:hypothetical protein